MNNQIFLSRFTPSLMTPEVLERIFVQRGDLAQHLVEIIREGVLSPAKHHKLILGPRGIGKTHLLSLVHNRVVGQEDLVERMRVAWLREEEWGVSSFLDLLHRILRTLVDTYGDPDLRAGTEELFSLAPKVAERRAGDLLRSFLDGRTLVVLAENLDDMFGGLGTKGQQRLRAYLQEEESWTIVSTAQGLFSGVSLHQSPFYGFFEVHHLQDLSVDDAATLIVNIARLVGDDDLATFVQSPAGRARIRAVHHLAGGNHRVYVILSEFLTRESLDELVEPFLKMIDGLTPYYQSRMAQLSSQQRKIIDFLAETRGAVPVKQIATRCFMTSQTASSQLKDLREKGYVRSTPIGRDSYYELSEPLMRIALEVKKQREDPIRLFLDFLRYWYPRSELEELLARVRPESALDREYLERAIDEMSRRDVEEPRLTTELDKCKAAGDWKNALETAKQLVETRGCAVDWAQLGLCLSMLGRWVEANSAYDRSVTIDGSLLAAWVGRWNVLIETDRAAESLEAIEFALEIEPATAHLLTMKGISLQKLGRLAEAMKSVSEALKLDPNLVPAWRIRADLLFRTGRASEAIQSIERVLGSDEQIPGDWQLHGRITFTLQRYEDAIESFNRHLAVDPRNLLSLMGYGTALASLYRVVEATNVFRRAIEHHPTSAAGWVALGLTYSILGNNEASLNALQTAVRCDPSGMHFMYLADALNDGGRSQEALRAIDNAERHGTQLHITKLARAHTYLVLGQLEEAVSLIDQALELLGNGEDLALSPLTNLVAALTRMPTHDSSRAASARAIYEVVRHHGLGAALGAAVVDTLAAFPDQDR
ncbi:MAG TPA: tetratricopeptide repeat protein, partial [Longimicrobiaceae bacterium]